ncbi:MAG: acyltransferase, partial [Roseburia lenta]|nr:acyltransferase [Roseburia lenta]
MVSRGEKRNSSLDLLKIIGMLFIIAHHYYVHGGFAPVSVDNISKGRIFLEQVSMYGSWSCDLFALITGFYMIGSKNDGKKRL